MSDHKGGGHPHGTYIFTVNGLNQTTNDPVPQGRQLLSSAGFDPPDEHVLIQLVSRETRSVSLDEEVDLREGQAKVFYAFRGDREFRFTLNGRGCEWGAAKISEPELRAIADIGGDMMLILDRQDEPDKELAAGDVVNLDARGTERIRADKRLVTVYFKNKPYELPRGVYTTEQLLGKFPIESGYLLNLKTEDGELVTLKPEQRVHIKDDMHFYSQAPGGSSS